MTTRINETIASEIERLAGLISDTRSEIATCEHHASRIPALNRQLAALYAKMRDELPPEAIEPAPAMMIDDLDGTTQMASIIFEDMAAMTPNPFLKASLAAGVDDNVADQIAGELDRLDVAVALEEIQSDDPTPAQSYWTNRKPAEA